MAAPLILDTDIGGDVDDALALALCLRHPDIDLRAVTSVSGDPVRRARIAARLLRLAGRDDVVVAAGRSADLPPGQPDRHVDACEAAIGTTAPGVEISTADGVSVVVEACRREPVTVCTIGPQSNMAAALDTDPGFAASVGRLVVMGGAFGPLEAHGHRFDAGADYNLQADRTAATRALNARIPTLYVPCDVTFGTALNEAHVDRLRKGDELCRTLARLVDAWTPAFRRLHPWAPPEQRAMMHDPLAVAVIVDGSFVTVEPVPVTVAVHNGKARTFVDPVEGVVAEVVRSVDAEAFADWWLDIVCVG